jgi:hypothetical protein
VLAQIGGRGAVTAVTAVTHFSRTRCPPYEHAEHTSAGEEGAASVSDNGAGSSVSIAGDRRAGGGAGGGGGGADVTDVLPDFSTHVTVRPENANRDHFKVAVFGGLVGGWVGGWVGGGERMRRRVIEIKSLCF